MIDFILCLCERNKVKLLVFFCILYACYMSFKYKTRTDFIDELHYNGYKVIQLFTERFYHANWGDDNAEFGNSMFNQCPDKHRCFVFKSIIKPYENSDAVIVHVPNLLYMPSRETYKRDPKQIWVFFTMESQRRSYCSSHYDIKQLDDWFNLTATFRTDSDMVFDYKPFRKLDDVKQDPKYIQRFQRMTREKEGDLVTGVDSTTYYENEARKKSGFAVWFVSHCETFSRREEYIQELRKYIPIDIYGTCTNNFKDSKPDPCNTTECMNKLLNSYKFYLSFENSQCDDYVTEKVWKFYESNSIFDVNIVPIVRGANKTQYNKSFEPISYINADDYRSPRRLAQKMLELNSSSSQYASYFKWKVDLIKEMSKINYSKITRQIKESDITQFSEIRTNLLCQVCSYLHNSTYLNSKTNRKWTISKWFGPNNCWDTSYEPSYVVDWLLKLIGFCI